MLDKLISMLTFLHMCICMCVCGDFALWRMSGPQIASDLSDYNDDDLCMWLSEGGCWKWLKRRPWPDSVMASSWSAESRIPHHTSTWFHNPFLSVSLSTWTTSVQERDLSQHTALAQHLRLGGEKKKPLTYERNNQKSRRENPNPKNDIIERTQSK